MPTLSTDPNDRMGVYKSMSDVPTRYKLGQFESAYHNYDVWQEYLDHLYDSRGDSQRKREQVNRAYENWTDFMAGQNRHYALATPSHVEEWSENLLTEYSTTYACNGYWAVIKRFYHWLQWHPDQPHRYNPFLMAAASHDNAAQLWNTLVSRPRSNDD